MSWGRDGNYNTSKYTESAFGSELQKLMKEITDNDPLSDALKKTRSGSGQIYTVRWGKLRAVLQKTGRYDPNAVV